MCAIEAKPVVMVQPGLRCIRLPLVNQSEKLDVIDGLELISMFGNIQARNDNFALGMIEGKENTVSREANRPSHQNK
jgi:hypothetical protein